MNNKNLKNKLYEIIFEADTPAGKYFDLALIVMIVLSIIVVMLESVSSLGDQYGRAFYIAEWFFTLLFTVEYIVRLYCISRPLKYARSFFGVVDLLSFLPTYIDLLVPGTRLFLIVRVLRLLRIFRVLKLVQYVGESEVLFQALKASRRKIFIFMFTVLTLVIILGSLMYVVEGEKNGFTSIPTSVYWAIVTITTVGYGDIAPHTPLGQLLATLIMFLGFSIIAVPTGIITVELNELFQNKKTTKICENCFQGGHDNDAKFCKLCGEEIHKENNS